MILCISIYCTYSYRKSFINLSDRLCDALSGRLLNRLVRGVLTGSVDDLGLMLIRYAPRIIKHKDVPDPQLDNFSSRLVPIEHDTSAFNLVGERCPY